MPIQHGPIKDEELPARAVPIKKKNLIEAAFCVVCCVRTNDVALDGVTCWKGADCWTRGSKTHHEPCFDAQIPCVKHAPGLLHTVSVDSDEDPDGKKDKEDEKKARGKYVRTLPDRSRGSASKSDSGAGEEGERQTSRKGRGEFLYGEPEGGAEARSSRIIVHYSL